MAQYTLTIQQIVNSNIEIFDFEYPLFNEEYKTRFEELFIDYFRFDEIGYETIGQFKHFLKVKLNLVMPYYNKIYETQKMEQRILDNYDVTEEIEKIGSEGNKKYISSNGNREGTTKNLYKDTPKTRIDINDFDIVNSISKDIISENGKATGQEESNTTNNERIIRTMKGNIGVQTDSDAIIKYWSSLRKVTLELFENELSSLFMGIY